MQEPPPEFREEFVALREHLELSLAQAEDTEERIAEARRTVALWTAFFGRWQKVLELFPEPAAQLEPLRGHVEALGRAVEALHLSELIEVVGARRTAEGAERLFRALVPFIQAMTREPAFRAEVLAELAAETGEETDPERMFRESEAAAAAEERNYRELLEQFRQHWPERVEPALQARLETSDPAQLQAWQEELRASLTHLQGEDWPPAAA